MQDSGLDGTNRTIPPVRPEACRRTPGCSAVSTSVAGLSCADTGCVMAEAAASYPSAMIVRWLTAVAIVISAALVGLAVWVLGLKGFANRAESICLADTNNRLGYGAYERYPGSSGRRRSNVACWETLSIQLMYSTRSRRS